MTTPYQINKNFFIYIMSNTLLYLDQQGYKIHRFKNDENWNKEEYAKELREVQAIFRKLICADAYVDKIFYIPLICDFRGRLYTRTMLSYQGDELSRSLICIFPGSESDFVRLDATASALQIVGSITGDPSNLLNETHLWEPLVNVDIYGHIAQSLHTEIRSRLILLLNNPKVVKHLISVKSQKSNLLLNEKQEINNIENLVDSFLVNDKKELFVNRKFAKAITMKYTYNQSMNGMTFELKTDHKEFLLSLEPIFNSKHIVNLKEKLLKTINKSEKKEIKATLKKATNPFRVTTGNRSASLIAFSFYKIMEKEFNFISNAKTITQKVSRHNNGFTVFGTGGPLSVSQFYPKHKIYKSKPCKGRKFSVNLKVETSPAEVDKKKSSISTMPNFIHNLDAFVLNYVVSRCRKYNYFVSTCHDCFIVESDRGKSVRKFYLDGIKLIIRNKVIRKFVSDNQTISIMQEAINNSRTGTKVYKERVDELKDFENLLEQIDKDVQNLINILEIKKPSNKVLSDESNDKFLKVGFLDYLKKK